MDPFGSCGAVLKPTTTDPSALIPFAREFPTTLWSVPKSAMPSLIVQRKAWLSVVPKVSVNVVALWPTTTEPSEFVAVAIETPETLPNVPRSLTWPSAVDRKAW